MLKVTIKKQSDEYDETEEEFLVTLAKRYRYKSFINDLITSRSFRKHEEWIENKTPLQFVLDLMDEWDIREDEFI